MTTMNANFSSKCVASSKIPPCDNNFAVTNAGSSALVGGTVTIPSAGLKSQDSLVFLTNTTNPPSGPLSAHTFDFTVNPPTFTVTGTGTDTFNWMILNQ